MKLLYIKSKSKFTTALKDKLYIPLEMEDGRQVLRQTAGDKIEKIITHHNTYVVPSDKVIALCCSAKDKYTVVLEGNLQIEIEKEQYDTLIKELEVL